MPDEKLRRRIVHEAARLIHQRQESDYGRAMRKATRTVSRRWVRAGDLPSHREIRAELQRFARDEAALEAEEPPDRFEVYRALLAPLANVREARAAHPEENVLAHGLQVFDLARDELPYDEEFQLAALLHDVGKGLDPYAHVQAGLEVLDGFITERTAWLIEHLGEAHALQEGTIGVRARRRLRQSESFEELLLLAECDLGGRVRGAPAPELGEALEAIRELARMCG